jgi:hypothetical protein
LGLLQTAYGSEQVNHSLREDPPVQTESSGPIPATASVPPIHRILAILWIFVSGPAVLLLVREPSWRKASPGLDRLKALHAEQWVAVILILIQLYFVLMARMDHVRDRVDREAGKPRRP